jgi:hypothetical protein
MKKVAIGFLLAIILGSTGFSSASRPADASIDAFWQKFKTAVTKGDKQAVFSMSQLPIGMSFGESRIRTKAQFIKNYKYIFAGEVNAVKCFATAKPQMDKGKSREFYVTCPFAENGGNEEPFVYTFKLTRNGWRFVSFENINE